CPALVLERPPAEAAGDGGVFRAVHRQQGAPTRPSQWPRIARAPVQEGRRLVPGVGQRGVLLVVEEHLWVPEVRHVTDGLFNHYEPAPQDAGRMPGPGFGTLRGTASQIGVRTPRGNAPASVRAGRS